MSTPQAMYRLTVVLAELYPDKASAIRVAESAALSTALVALNDRAIDNWHAILQETVKQDRLAPLLAVVDEEYGASPQWRAVKYQLAGWPAPVATLAVLSQQLTPRRVGLVATVMVVLVIIGVWGNSWLRSQQQQLSPAPTATAAVTAPISTSFTYGVTVLDATDQPVPRAQVIIEIEGKAPLENEADSSGFARLEVPTSYMERAGRLRVYADGFAPFDQNIDIYPERLPNTVRLLRP